MRLATTPDVLRDHHAGLEYLTRLGFAAKGIVYLLIGLLALLAALGEGGETTDRSGVIDRIAAQPFGEVAVTIIAVGLAAYALWRFMCAILDKEHEGSDKKALVKRIGWLISGLLYASASVYAFRVLAANGASQDKGDDAPHWSARLMNAPAGELLLAAIGVGIIAFGIAQIRRGWTERFRKHLRGGVPHWAITAGKWGHIARGVVFGIIGGFIVRAAIRHSPGEARGLERTLDTIAGEPYLLGALAAGLACYGAYCMIEAKYRRVNV